VPKCALHPGRDSVTIVFGKNYCEKCREGIAAARHRVDRHVEPKDCWWSFQQGGRVLISAGW